MRLEAIGVAITIGLALAGCSPMGQSDPAEGDWPLYGRDSNEQRFSPLEDINPSNVKNLGLAWSLDLPFEARTLEATPLEVDGVLYFTASLSVAYAIDAATGKQLWSYDPQAGAQRPRALRIVNGISRGLAYDDGKVIIGASDGRLIALDAKTGKPIWSVQTIEDPEDRKQITGAPRVFNGKVIIGNAGADVGTRGYVTAYDVRTGRKLWRFFVVPGDPAKGFEDEAQAMAARTWGGEWWKWGGGGTPWNGITFDAEFNRIYVGTGNSANYNPEQRSPGGGDNLFLASIVALDADTGKYVWHYQVNPREAWDFKATADMMLADLTIDGKPRKVLMQAPTNGFFYVLDRTNGKLISAEKLGKVTWASHIDLKTGRPVEAPNIRYEKGPVTFWPSPWGIHNWQAMAFSPKTGLVYIPTMKMSATYSATPQDAKDAESLVIGSRRYHFPIGATFAMANTDPDDGTGALVAWDPVAQKARWTVKQKNVWNGGTLATASGLVFQGTGDGWLHAHDAENGKELWKFYTGNGIIAPPITYSVKGVQYLTILAGYGGSAPDDPGWRYGIHAPRVLTFKLGGTARLAPMPGPVDTMAAVPGLPKLDFDDAAAQRGQAAWFHTCGICHGTGTSPSAIAPDLRQSAGLTDFAYLQSIVQGGALAVRGMPQYDEMPDAELRDIQMFLRRAASAPPTKMQVGPAIR